MGSVSHTCSKSVDGIKFVKNGKTKQGKQRFKCKDCGTTFLKSYTYKACKPDSNWWIINLMKEGSGIRSISRLLSISPTTVINRILSISKQIKPPMIPLNKKFEVDELWTFIGSKTKRRYIAYSLRTDTKEVLRFSVGTRTQNHLKKITEPLVLAQAKGISTDRLKEYRAIIPKKIHKVKQYKTNHIERMNTTLRCHLKRLNRKTIAYSKSLSMLNACLAIYFWG